MHSRVTYIDEHSGERREVELVFPEEADLVGQRQGFGARACRFPPCWAWRKAKPSNGFSRMATYGACVSSARWPRLTEEPARMECMEDMDMRGTIQLTRQDAERLAHMAEALAAQSRGIQKQLRVLDGLMTSAQRMDATDAPDNVVTLDSRIIIEDLYSGELKEIELVFPEESDPPSGKLSVLRRWLRRARTRRGRQGGGGNRAG
ncbi:MAG: hypothetical protein M5R42_06380 [Rhodocyclaceae bacterium]|nr:hypothetical protein [Rhodocyclaceae bacterium]